MVVYSGKGQFTELTPSEAVFGFATYISSQNFNHKDSGSMAFHVNAFCQANNFSAPRKDWQKILKKPRGVYF